MTDSICGLMSRDGVNPSAIFQYISNTYHLSEAISSSILSEFQNNPIGGPYARAKRMVMAGAYATAGTARAK